jgi:hypothetical protein
MLLLAFFSTVVDVMLLLSVDISMGKFIDLFEALLFVEFVLGLHNGWIASSLLTMYDCCYLIFWNDNLKDTWFFLLLMAV